MVGTVTMKESLLLLVDADFVHVGAALSAIRGFHALEDDGLLVITQASQLSNIFYIIHHNLLLPCT